MLKKLAAVAITAGLMSPALMTAQPPQESKKQEAREERREAREHHPHIRAAIHELEEAKKELQSAAHDFGGHRVEAIEAIDNALKQLHEALEYDKK
jgi:hypothetical protein